VFYLLVKVKIICYIKYIGLFSLHYFVIYNSIHVQDQTRIEFTNYYNNLIILRNLSILIHDLRKHKLTF